jgi:hypothetical protein
VVNGASAGRLETHEAKEGKKAREVVTQNHSEGQEDQGRPVVLMRMLMRFKEILPWPAQAPK